MFGHHDFYLLSFLVGVNLERTICAMRDFHVFEMLFAISTITKFDYQRHVPESFVGNFFDLQHPQNETFHSLPDGHEREAQEKTKRSAKLCQEGLEGVDQDLFLKLGVLGYCPEAKHHLVFWIVDVVELFEVCIDKLILLVTARSFTASQLYNLRQRHIGQVNVEFLKLPEKNSQNKN